MHNGEKKAAIDTFSALAALAVLALAVLVAVWADTVCDRGSACDLFGCEPGCDRFEGAEDVPVVAGPGGLEDDAAPSTTLEVCAGPLPSLSVRDNAEDGCQTYTVSYSQGVHAAPDFLPDYLSSKDDDTFRHVYFIAGSPACVFTGSKRTPHAGRISDVDGGRDCNSGGPEQCAYVSEGYRIYAVTGKSCSEAGVPICGGPFCR